MALYLIGIGLGNEKDISLKGLEIVKKCDKIYLESYTSKLQCSIKNLAKLYGKKVTTATRKMVEDGMDTILDEAKKKNIALLVIGSVFAATTHINYLIEAKKQNVEVEIIENASIFTAVGLTGLSLYNFGKITSIPFENKNVDVPIKVIKENLKNNMHTLVLLDIKDEKLMSINEALIYLNSKGISENQLIVGCSGLGNKDFQIKTGKLSELIGFKFNLYPQCLIIPAKKLHFVEEEALEMWKL